MYETHVLFLMLKDDGYHKRLRMIYSDMHRGLKFEDFDYLDVLWHEYHVHDKEHYLNVLWAGITHPRFFLKHTIDKNR